MRLSSISKLVCEIDLKKFLITVTFLVTETMNVHFRQANNVSTDLKKNLVIFFHCNFQHFLFNSEFYIESGFTFCGLFSDKLPPSTRTHTFKSLLIRTNFEF